MGHRSSPWACKDHEDLVLVLKWLTDRRADRQVDKLEQDVRCCDPYIYVERVMNSVQGCVWGMTEWKRRLYGEVTNELGLTGSFQGNVGILGGGTMRKKMQHC